MTHQRRKLKTKEEVKGLVGGWGRGGAELGEVLYRFGIDSEIQKMFVQPLPPARIPRPTLTPPPPTTLIKKDVGEQTSDATGGTSKLVTVAHPEKPTDDRSTLQSPPPPAPPIPNLSLPTPRV